MSSYKNVKACHHQFVFKYDKDHPELLHIWVRHLKTEDDAIYIFFNGETVWNKQQDCWETSIEKEGIWWFWLDEAKKVIMIISCFDDYVR